MISSSYLSIFTTDIHPVSLLKNDIMLLHNDASGVKASTLIESRIGCSVRNLLLADTLGMNFRLGRPPWVVDRIGGVGRFRSYIITGSPSLIFSLTGIAIT